MVEWSELLEKRGVYWANIVLMSAFDIYHHGIHYRFRYEWLSIAASIFSIQIDTRTKDAFSPSTDSFARQFCSLLWLWTSYRPYA